MKKVIISLAAVALSIIGIAGVHQAPQSAPQTVHACTSVNGLPDAICTPGAIDTRVTQNNIQTTICKPGYTATVRPAQSYTYKLKIQGIKDYGYTDTRTSSYEEDHLISLELGGSPDDPKNLWPENPPTPNPKDSVENELHRRVCNGLITLKDAQIKISKDWRNAL